MSHEYFVCHKYHVKEWLMEGGGTKGHRGRTNSSSPVGMWKGQDNGKEGNCLRRKYGIEIGLGRKAEKKEENGNKWMDECREMWDR